MGQDIPGDGTTLCSWGFLPFPIDNHHSSILQSVVAEMGQLPFGDTFVLVVFVSRLLLNNNLALHYV